MRHIQNTLYVTQEDAFLQKDGESIVVRHDHKKIAQFPIIAVGEIICFGFGISVSAPLAEYCATSGVTVSYISGTGKFLARMVGAVHGNVLLRRAQYRCADEYERACPQLMRAEAFLKYEKAENVAEDRNSLPERHDDRGFIILERIQIHKDEDRTAESCGDQEADVM